MQCSEKISLVSPGSLHRHIGQNLVSTSAKPGIFLTEHYFYDRAVQDKACEQRQLYGIEIATLTVAC